VCGLASSFAVDSVRCAPVPSNGFAATAFRGNPTAGANPFAQDTSKLTERNNRNIVHAGAKSEGDAILTALLSKWRNDDEEKNTLHLCGIP